MDICLYRIILYAGIRDRIEIFPDEKIFINQ
jgi:hypothetical protein